MNSQSSVTPNAVMYWDGGERAITPREKAGIEEHGPSCFSIALVPATPSARWAADGLPDPHAGRYACERAALTLGNLTDDELANAVYLHGNEQPSMADLVAGKALSGIVYLTAAKDRIRWLSRALATTCKQPLQAGEVHGDALTALEAAMPYLETLHSIVGGEARASVWRCIERGRAALAARQPVAHQQPSFGKVREIRIPARNKLDPISVFVQDQAWGRGRIVVTCYGNAWQGFWGAMGDRTVMQFVAQCDADYVAGNMISGRQTRMTKAEQAYTQRIAAEVIAELRALIDDQRDPAPEVGNGD